MLVIVTANQMILLAISNVYAVVVFFQDRKEQLHIHSKLLSQSFDYLTVIYSIITIFIKFQLY